MGSKCYCGVCHQETETYHKLFCDYCGKEMQRRSAEVKVRPCPGDEGWGEECRADRVRLVVQSRSPSGRYVSCCVDCMINLLKQAIEAQEAE